MSRYAFGDIAINSTEKKKPEPVDKATYIGLEHLDSGCLTVRRFGADVAPIGDKLVMKKGDVLFGKRRAYQKKVAIAPFDGIFSAHGMVLRPKTEVIDKDFFPLFIASDYFLDAAIRISVGSLSPTINWSDLKALEFSLPPLDEQRRLAQLLWAALDLKEAYQTMLARCDEMASSRFVEMFRIKEHPLVTLDDLSLGQGEYGAQSAAAEYNPDRPRYVRITDINDDGSLNNDFVSSSVLSDDEQYKLCYGDFLFARMGATVGKTYAYKSGSQIYAGYLIRYKLNLEKILPEYLYAYTKTNEYWSWVKNNQSGAAQPGINAKKYGSMLIPIASIDEQRVFAAFIEQLDKSKVALQKSIERLDNLIKTLLQEHLG